jgi:GWxTD domain-containing protein
VPGSSPAPERCLRPHAHRPIRKSSPLRQRHHFRHLQTPPPLALNSQLHSPPYNPAFIPGICHAVAITQVCAFVWAAILSSGFFCPGVLIAQESQGSSNENLQNPETVGQSQAIMPHPCFAKRNGETSAQRAANVIAGLPDYYRYWLTEDAVYIITFEERCAFLRLQNDREREQFIEQFWSRRSSNPEALENDFQAEHYRRIIFANQKFGTQTPGWKTDRGHTYVIFGPPDKIETHLAGESPAGPPEETPATVGHPWERWHYRYIEGVGESVDLDFVDPTASGNFRLTMPPEEQDDLLFSPGHFTLSIASDKDLDRDARDKIEIFVGPSPTPVVHYKDLEAIVVSRIIRDQIHFASRIQFLKVTHASSIAAITVEISGDRPGFRPDIDTAAFPYQVFGRLSKPSGWVVSTFEGSSKSQGPPAPPQGAHSLQFAVPLSSGSYKLALVAKDASTGEIGVIYETIEVPSYDQL